MVTGDVADKNNEGGYKAFLELIDALGPGNLRQIVSSYFPAIMTLRRVFALVMPVATGGS